MAPKLPLEPGPFRLAEAVGREYASHVQHTRNRAARDLLARADRLRSHPDPADPVVAALTALCHTEAGRIHASPHLVAAVALEAVAALLAAPEPLDAPSEETHGHA